jgi:acrylyl-CoA reductase (NADPH)
MSLPASMRAFVVDAPAEGKVAGQEVVCPTAGLPAQDTIVRVLYSSLNYKDALAVQGHPGIVKKFPHIPGIDAVGEVVSSDRPDLVVGRQVLVTGYELGAGQWGGWAEYIRVPGDWVIPLPAGLTPFESMVLGTAGLTVALSVYALGNNGVAPESGPILVTGATGGVGCLAVSILAKLGYYVVASTGKAERKAWLQELGAAEVIDRQSLIDTSGKPLLSGRWAGAIDSVGGDTLNTIIRSLRPNGCVAVCGLVGGTQIQTTVYPFLLRGVRVIGIDSAWCPLEKRRFLWRQLATDWKPPTLEMIAHRITLKQIPAAVQALLDGQGYGRTVVDIAGQVNEAQDHSA